MLKFQPEWIEHLAGLGYWLVEGPLGAPLTAQSFCCSSQALVLLGQPSQAPATVAGLLALCHGDDRPTLTTLFRQLATSSPGRQSFCCCRLADQWPDVWLRFDAELLIEAECPLIIGTLQQGRDPGRASDERSGGSERLNFMAARGLLGTWDWDLLQNRFYGDAVLCRQFGRASDSWGRDYQAWISAIYLDDRDRIDVQIQASLRGERMAPQSFRVSLPDGEIRQLLSIGSLRRDSQGRPVHLVGVTIDLTELLASEDSPLALRLGNRECQPAELEAQDLYHPLMRYAPVGMALCAPQSNLFLQVNPSFCAFFKRNEAELLSMTWSELTYPEDVNCDQPLANMLLLGRLDSYRIRKRFLRPNGSLAWGDLSVAAIKNPDGTPRTILYQIIDITELLGIQDQLKDQQRQLRSTLDSLLDPHVSLAVVRDASGEVKDFRFIDANETALDVLHLSKDKLLDSSLLAIVPGISHSPLMSLLMQAVHTGEPVFFDDVPDPTGGLVPVDGYVEIRAVRVNGFISLTWRDVTERHHMIQRIAASEQQHRLLTENASDVVMLVRQGLIEWISPALSRMLGWSPANWIGHPFEQFVHPDDLGLAKQSCQDEQHGGSSVTRLRLRDPKGKHHWVEAHSSAIFSNEGIQEAIVASFRTVDQEVAIEQELERRARFDDLTGLVNRSEMLERFRILLSSRPRKVPLAILFIDIDEFKLINDTYGHFAGDTVLKSMAQRIHQAIRKRDWAARIGGDEMLVALPGLNDLGKAMMIAEKIRAAAHRPLAFAEHQISFSISVGVTLASSTESVDAILARADRAMYQAKQRGRDQVMAISPD